MHVEAPLSEDLRIIRHQPEEPPPLFLAASHLISYHAHSHTSILVTLRQSDFFLELFDQGRSKFRPLGWCKDPFGATLGMDMSQHPASCDP